MKRTRPSPRSAGPCTFGLWLLAGAVSGATQARADVINWSNTNGGTFGVGSNWIGGVVPGANDFAQFSRTRNVNSPLSYTVSFGGNPSNLRALTLDHVTFDLNGHSYLLTQSNSGLGVGAALGGTGSLTITDGVVATTHPTGKASVGFGSGSAVLTISTGGQLLGPELAVGSSASGTLVVQNGGDLVSRSVYIGLDAGVTGAATITGAGSTAVTEQLSVGFNGTGTLDINNGGRVESTVGMVGTLTSGVGIANVAGANSRWTSSGGMYAGFEGRGTLNITGGGRVENTLGVVCSDDMGSGSASVDGPGSQWNNSSDLLVGERGTAVLSVTSGGQVRSAGGYVAQLNGIGSVSVSGAGSAWTMTGDLSIGGYIGQGINGGSATLEIGPGGTVIANRMFIFPGDIATLRGGTLDVSRITHAFDSTGRLEFRSGILHAGVVEMNVLNQGGTLAPGHSAGSTSITGNYTQQAAATVEIEIGGTSPGTQFDLVVVQATAFLGGRLNLRLINGFVPTGVQTFAVLDAGAINGGFTNAANGQRIATLDAGGSFVVHYGAGSPFDPTQVVLSGFGPCPSDFNRDGFIDFFDFDAFVACFEGNICPPGQDADFNDDGFADFFDLSAYVEAFEAGC